VAPPPGRPDPPPGPSDPPPGRPDATALRARLTTAQGDPEIGAERITVHHQDGRVEELRLHDYARLYALPGVYEQIVTEDLGCQSPEAVAQFLIAALEDHGRDRAAARVLDIAAGNGVSGEALLAAGVTPVLGTDIVPQARDAALRDRPDVYGEYLTLDLTALSDEQGAAIRALRANALTCVAPVGDRPGQVPPAALAAAARLLAGDAIVVHLHDPRHDDPDPVTEAFWRRELPGAVEVTRLDHRRYLHRFTVSGGPYEMESAVWSIRRDAD
jgi:hypothetical protein